MATLHIMDIFNSPKDEESAVLMADLISPNHLPAKLNGSQLSQLPLTPDTPELGSNPSRDDASDMASDHTPINFDPLPESTDVVIIGAGPAGLTLACELARRGVNFLIFDINAGPVTQSRALLLHARSLEIFADIGVSEAAVLNGHIIRGGRVLVDNKQVMDIKFTGIQSPFPFSLVLEQSQTEQLLLERLQELGHQVRRPVAVWKVEVPEIKPVIPAYTDAKGSSPANVSMMIAAHDALNEAGQLFQSGISTSGAVGQSMPLTPMAGGTPVSRCFSSIGGDSLCTVHVKTLDFYGRPVDCPVSTIRCKYVVGADGAKSSVRRAVEIPFESHGPTSEFLVADIAVHWGADLGSDRLHLLQNSSGVLMAIPMTEGHWRIICMRKCSSDIGETIEPFSRLTAPDFTELQQIVSALVPGTTLGEALWTSAFAVNCRIAQTFRRSSALLVGDAAHIHTPTFGLGMNTGIHDAFNLGWKLAAVLKGASADLLDFYSTERRQAAKEIARTSTRVFESLVKTSAAIRCVISTLGPLLNGLDMLSDGFTGMISQTNTKYNPSSIIGKNFLSRGAIEPGVGLLEASVVTLPLISEDVYNGSEMPQGISHLARGGHHTLFLCVHVLPPGTKVRTIFGCERNEEAVRWNATCLERLAKIARLFAEAFRGRETEVAWGGLTVVWVLCGLINFRSPKNNVGLGQIRDHIPHRLIYFFTRCAKIGARVHVAVDYEGEVHSHLGLKLADPDGFQGSNNSGAFVLIRPDGHVCCNGYAGDNAASGFAFDYALSWLSD